MTDKQKIFIRGVGGRGDEVIKTLTDLGGKNCDDLNGENSNVVYFITHTGIIGYTSLESEVACMISEYCHEVKLPERWRDGNILVMKNNPNQFAVYNDDLVVGKRWNAMNKTVEDCRDALPDDDTIYFYIASNGDVQAAVFEDLPINHERFHIGNFFHTREEANGMAEKVKKLLKGE